MIKYIQRYIIGAPVFFCGETSCAKLSHTQKSGKNIKASLCFWGYQLDLFSKSKHTQKHE